MVVAVNAPPHSFLPSELPSLFIGTSSANHSQLSASSSLPLEGLRPSQKQRRKGFRGKVVSYHHDTSLRCYHKLKPIISSTTTTCSTASTVSTVTGEIKELLEVTEIKERCKKWQWRGHSINYLIYQGKDYEKLNYDDKPSTNLNPPLLLVHGFGASIAHWRRSAEAIAAAPAPIDVNSRFYVIDSLSISPLVPFLFGSSHGIHCILFNLV
ncbi:unnamed protein product [Ilex paraguariensis]|uniref:Uncharacterized protein n=1 Tax=Ilex paraguariensis TaxID=185542 RepID=A0ABC8S1P4_9AQUA